MDNGKNEQTCNDTSETEALAAHETENVKISGERIMAEEIGKEERIYTIPLRDVKKAPRWKRSNKAIALIREYLMQHTKSEFIVLDTKINEKVWERGSQKPPSRIRVKVRTEEEIVRAELVE